eukprot:scaffold71310_cov37-Phaeocystis_antarctica.AAC.2
MAAVGLNCGTIEAGLVAFEPSDLVRVRVRVRVRVKVRVRVRVGLPAIGPCAVVLVDCGYDQPTEAAAVVVAATQALARDEDVRRPCIRGLG